MHPILGSRAKLGAYLLGWVPVGALLAVQAASRQTPILPAIILGFLGAYLAAVAFLSSFFLCRSMPLQSTRTSVLLTTWTLASVAMGTLWALGLGFLLAQLGRLYPAVRPLGGLNPALLAIGCVLYLLTVALHYLLIAMERSREVERSEQEQRVLAREAELKALRAQLNPHFLFNSLNSISALTSIDAKRARQMCVLLSDFLRKSLKLGERASVPLSEELDLLRNYLAIEQIRFGERLKVDLEIDPLADGAQVPPLLLQPLVENAIKHGISQVEAGGTLTVRTRRFEDFVEVRVDNPVDEDAEAPVGLGLGLRQVKLRLQGRFADRTRFEATLQGGVHRVILIFPLETESPDRRLP